MLGRCDAILPGFHADSFGAALLLAVLLALAKRADLE